MTHMCLPRHGLFTRNIERFHSLAPMYYRNAAAAVVVYDITKAVSAIPFTTLFAGYRLIRFGESLIELVGKGQGVGERIAEAGQPEHCHRARG